MTKPPDIFLIKLMIEACQKIVARVEGRSESDLSADDILLDAVLKQFENLGEAVALVSQKMKDANPGVQWQAIKGMRNRLVHVYWNVDVSAVWETAARDIPLLLEQLNRIKESFHE